MSLNKFRIAIATAFLFVFQQGVHAQIDQQFVAHLSKNQLQSEHLAYLDENAANQEDFHYYFAKYHLQYGNDSLFFSHFKLSNSLFFADSNAVNFASVHFLQGKKSTYWFDSCLSMTPFRYRETRELLHVYQSVNTPKTFDPQYLPANLQYDFSLYKKASAKNPFVSSALSAVVPGLGKLYIGNRRSFSITLLSLTILGLQSYESYRSLGIKNPLTVINLGFFATYYAVNIFGSFRETKQKTKEFKNQYLINATTYYRYKYHNGLYN